MKIIAIININITGSPWRDQISNAILMLQENGELQVLYKKWWEIEGKDPSKKCDHMDDKKKDSANELSLANVGGVFVVLAAGLALSFFVALFEFIWKARQASNDQVNTFYSFHFFFIFITPNYQLSISPLKKSSLKFE